MARGRPTKTLFGTDAVSRGRIAHGYALHNDRQPYLKADFIRANQPFNISDSGGERLRGDRRGRYNAPLVRNSNFAWVHRYR